MSDDFSQHPETLGEYRTAKTDNARDWAPRDALIAALRAIDSGEVTAEAAVIVLRCRSAKGKDIRVRWFAASPDPHISMGMCMEAAYRMGEG